MKAVATVLGVISAIIVLCSVLVMALTWRYDRYCEIRADGIGVEYKYSFLGGCRIEIDGRFIPINSYRVTNEEGG